jgi:hypothetical protein
MMEAADTSETLVKFYQTARRYNPEDSHLLIQNGRILNPHRTCIRSILNLISLLNFLFRARD